MDPTGSASVSGAVQVGDQLCEVTPVADTDTTTTTTNDATCGPVNLLGAPFDFVMQTFAGLDRTVRELDLVFFRGSKDELKAVCTGGEIRTDPETVTVTVVQNKGAENEMIRQLTAPAGANVRELLVSNGINVYQSVTRWTNCSGKQLCGTCIVNLTAGARSTNRKSMDESSTLRENPDSYRLSCVTFAYGDVTVETFPPISAAQWTR
jgi:ferredoxin